MSERYNRVFKLPENLYAENSPVIISAGALLKDNQTGNMLVQLKIKNITNIAIKAVRISITTFDIAGEKIDDEVKYEYLDLSIGRNFEFGQKVPIILPNNSTRSFSVAVNQIVFSDNSLWNYENEEWFTLKEANKLETIFNDFELEQQYKIEYGNKCTFEVTEDRDVWICSCGEVSKIEESKCFNCGCSLQTLKNIDLSELNENKEKRLAKVESEKENLIKKRKKLAKIITIISAIVILILLSINLIYNLFNTDKVKAYNEANKLLESNGIVDIKKSAQTFKSLNGFKDSDKKAYEAAIKMIQTGNSLYANQAAEIINDLGRFEESIDIIYEMGINEGPNYGSPYFEAIGNYLKENKKKFLEEDEIEKIMVGSWFTGIEDFYGKYVVFDEYGYGEHGYLNCLYGDLEWYAENDTLKIHVERYYGDLYNSYKLINISDDVLVLYDISGNESMGVLVAEDSEVGKSWRSDLY